MEKNSKIFVAGGTGLVGSAIIRVLISRGYNNIISNYHIKKPGSELLDMIHFVELDLKYQKDVDAFFEKEKSECVILAAAKVGGIIANDTLKAEFIYDNIMIASNIIHASHAHGVRKLLNLGSSCIYPKFAPQPMNEDYLLTGELESTNEPYAIAKIAAIKLCRYYNEQYNTNFISVMPTNLYGPNDNFDLINSHVLPALIRKLHLGKLFMNREFDLVKKDFIAYGNSELDTGEKKIIIDSNSTNEDMIDILNYYGIYNIQADNSDSINTIVEIWGTGSPYREFLYVDDLADAIVFLMERYDYKDIGEFINIGTGKDMTIRNLSLLVKRIVDFKGEVRFDSSKPDGTPKKLLDVSLINSLGWESNISLEEGIKREYEWFLSRKIGLQYADGYNTHISTIENIKDLPVVKKALITGITGQDGSYLAELLLDEGYEVHGVVRQIDMGDENYLRNIAHIKDKIYLHIAKLDNSLSVNNILQQVNPDEIYHLAASSFVSYSFEHEFSFINFNIDSTYCILAAIKEYSPHSRLFFAGSSEMFGNVLEFPQNENTGFNPRSIYGISKLTGYNLLNYYRDRYGIYVCTGILYNHESTRRAIQYVTRKITSSAALIKNGMQEKINLGNIDAVRDWGYSPDFVKAMWLMLQQDLPDDFVIATGKLNSVRDVLEIAFGYLDLDYKKFLNLDEEFFRESEKNPLCGDTSKAYRKLGWKPKKTLEEIIIEMVDYDISLIKQKEMVAM